jgi:hypothetical protein
MLGGPQVEAGDIGGLPAALETGGGGGRDGGDAWRNGLGSDDRQRSGLAGGGGERCCAGTDFDRLEAGVIVGTKASEVGFHDAKAMGVFLRGAD